MFGSHYYNKNIRNIVVLFGTLFNDLSVKRVTAAGATADEFKIPIAYGPSEKFIAKLGGKDELSLPRMSFEITDYAYDSTRKLQTTKKFTKVKSGSTTDLTTVFNPVPYDFNITLVIMVKYSDDGTQILEQILPYFTPAFQVTLKEMKDSFPELKRDIPVILNSVSTEDTYEGDFITRRVLLHTLTFTVKGYIYSRTSDQGLIRTVDANVGGIDNPTIVDGALVGDMNIEITPKALTDLNTDGSINAADNALVMPDDEFGFIETITEP